MLRSVLLIAALGTAACDGSDDGAGRGTDVRVRDAAGKVVADIDGEAGEVRVDVPGFTRSIGIPKIMVDASDIDLNGVGLYPGSTVRGLNLAGREAWGGGDAGLRVSFSSPAAAATVRSWFGERLGRAGFTVRADGHALTGRTADGRPFRLEMRPAGARASTGEIVIG